MSRYARGLLGWSLLDLRRAARVSVSAVKRIEDGDPVTDADHLSGMIRGARESAGVMFLSENRWTGVLLRAQ